MGKYPWSCVPGWDVPRDYFDPDLPDPNEENFDEMIEERMDIQEALEADGEKLRQMTGKEHGPFCPRCLANPLGPNPVFLGSESEGHICGDCWQQDRAADDARR